jgi:hypothetical protein
MKLAKLTLVGAAFASLAACQTGQNVPDVVTNRPAPVARPVVPPMDLQNVQWRVRDLDGLKALVADMERTGQNNAVFYVLTQDQYDALAMNLAEVKRYIADQDAANEFLGAALDTNARPAPQAAPAPAEEPKPRRRRFGLF